MNLLPEYASFFRNWVRICLLNLLVVVILGSTMRYKIAFALPWLPQKNILNAHSHFAFSGWLTQILMTLMVLYLSQTSLHINLRKYHALLWANLAASWGMLLSFPWEGYGTVSIIFSTATVLASYAFAWVFWRDLNRIPERLISKLWFKASLVWAVLSSIGPFFLAYLMANRVINHEHWYLGAIYYYLHFQYNGWFFFACAGLLLGSNLSCTRNERWMFWLFALSCAPAYMLSILWAKLPMGAYGITLLATMMQTCGWVLLLRAAWKKRIVLLQSLRPTVRVLMIFAAVSGSIKFLLQAGSLHPQLAKLAFGFRPIVIGYLHLVFLGLLSIFIVALLKHLNLFAAGGWRKQGLITFITGIIFQEILLFVQGTMALVYVTVPYINEMLFLSAVVMLSGVLMMNFGMAKRAEPELAPA
ncbi:MAG: hypothetical protein JST06_06845 [Bacteroidetes bacterium]|nr:hypothetical protein [Bacteroidota bacterium]MBS1629924.1 hypothetical protein [Bacteroidota bacterium]